MSIGNVVSLIAGVFGIMGMVGGFVTWILSRNTNKIEGSITRALTPLTYEIKTLNSHLEVNAAEHKGFRKELDEHGDLLNDHNTRISILENTGGK